MTLRRDADYVAAPCLHLHHAAKHVIFCFVICHDCYAWRSLLNQRERAVLELSPGKALRRDATCFLQLYGGLKRNGIIEPTAYYQDVLFTRKTYCKVPDVFLIPGVEHVIDRSEE